MSPPEEHSQRLALRRIGELEGQLDAARRRADGAESELARITGNPWWRVLSRLRRAVQFGRDKAHVDNVPSLVKSSDAMWKGAAADFIARLPADALASPSESAGGGVRALRRVDFATVMPGLSDAFRSCRAVGAVEDTGVREPRAASWRVAFIGGDELRRDLGFDAEVVAIGRSGWRDQLAPGRFDFMLIEGGTQGPSHDWAAAFAGEDAGREELLAVLETARKNGLPVAAWALQREADTVGAVHWLWPHVDVVFAADAAHAARVSESRVARCVEWLPLCIQPQIYNPITVPSLLKAARFGRQRLLLDDLEACVANEAAPRPLSPLLDRLLLADSRWEVSEASLAAVPQLASLSLGSISPFDRAALLRLVGAEVLPGTPLDAKRALQAEACGAVAIDLSVLARDGQSGHSAVDTIDAQLKDALVRARKAHLNVRRILSHDCVADRLERMVEALGLKANSDASTTPVIACLLVSRRPQLLAACLERFRADLYPKKELVIVVHRDDADLPALRAMIRPGELVRVLQMGEEWSLGACLNLAFAQTDATYWAKWDDDDFYGPHYLSDFMLYRRAVDFDIAGKPRAFSWFEESGKLLWDERWAARANVLRTAADTRNTGIAGATLVGHRRVLEATPFPEARKRGTDSEFLRQAIDHGWTVLSTDPFNFVRFRSADSGFHTWNIREPQADLHARSIGGAESIASVAFI